MVVLLSLFGLSLAGIIAIPMRHVPRVRDNVDVPDENSLVRIYVIGFVEICEHWYEKTAKAAFLKILDRILKFFEQTAGQLAGQFKNMRLMVQERFRVIPRESLYWRSINTWKKENGHATAQTTYAVEESDVSNHSF